MNTQGITLLKLGGSTITDKHVNQSVKREKLQALIAAIHTAQKESSDKFIIGHGSGSFAHIPAKKYQTHLGFVNNESLIGMTITQDTAAKLNRIVVEECLRERIPAVSYNFSNTLVTSKTKPFIYSGSVLLEYLKLGLTPVISGDVIVDTKQGCCIWSADTILPFLAGELKKEGYHISRMVHITNTHGVYIDFADKSKGVFEKISSSDLPKLSGTFGQAEGTDVTGGMLQKVTESIELAKRGVESVIVSGSSPENVKNALLGLPCKGTKIIK